MFVRGSGSDSSQQLAGSSVMLLETRLGSRASEGGIYNVRRLEGPDYANATQYGSEATYDALGVLAPSASGCSWK